ncbi:Separin [Penicillium ucsense]|uniref:separase n=1 Tax=Penicillium ucsense TaxID=2839758 RepID=A0A8J8VVQ8_9EURO|nr:Separin [Penicillium ucsense]KAF7728964.1 Separin [Penicillium ucsense]
MSESIKQAVRSTSTCSDVTVLSLQTLLRGLPKVPEKPVRRATKTTKEATTTTSRARAATRTTKARTSTDVTLRIVDQDGATLSPQEKLVLATEVFNTTLKTLTDASKTATTRRPAAVSETVSVKSGRTNGSVVDKGAAATAECARLALATLRALKTETQSSNDYPNMQLEQGACILAGKMITLGLNEMACKELRALKRRIQQYLDARAVGERTGSTKDNAEEDTGKERMSDLLTFSNIAHAESVYSLLVPYHANVMRLLAADRKSSTTARLISFLQLVDPSSPASVILAAMESGNLTSEKAALQLQLLSNTILSLCPSKSMSTDEATAKDSLQPISILSLQLLSLEIRALSWKLSGHVCQETKELVDPLLRYLGSFSHRSKSVEKSEFGAIFKTITRIQTTMAEVKKQRQENKDITASARIMTVLGQLALDAGCFEESLKLFNKAVIPFFNAQSLALATARCKIAAVYFQGLKGSQKFAEGALKAISEASTALGMQLRGNVSDLDELLVEAARLKKLALAWFGDAMGKEDNTEKDEIASNMREYLQAFLRLLWRYVGRPPAEECDEKELQLYKSRITMSKNIILAGVDSVVAIGRLSIMSQKPSWADMLPILADSHRLLTSVESADGVDSDPAFAEHVNIALVKLSNLFWSRFVKEKEAGQGYRELMPLLKQSTSLLGTCPMTHRKSAFAALKYERTAHVYLDASKYDDAEHAFRSSILEYVDAGVLEDVAKVSAGDSPHIIEYDSKSSAFAFTRVLSAFLKLKLRKKGSKSSSPLIYDDERLDSRSRGTLIEWQMRLLCDLRSYASSDEGFRAVFNPVVHLVMDLYPSNAHHIRRARVLLFALRFSLEHPPCMSAELTNKVLEEAAQVLNYGNGVGLDPDMTSFETHITNSLRVIIGFHHGKIDESELNDTLSSWSAIIRQCADAESLSHSITDVDYWVLQLKALVDYTEIHSLWKTQLSVLELILRVVEIMKSGDFSDAISILARLVIQHCHLGHCQKAGDLLARGEQYVDHSQTSIIAKIAYQLARVEYLLETGDIEKADHVLATARVLYEKGRDTEELKNLTGLAKISLERLVADAAFIHSRLSTAQGSMTQALYFAKLAVRLNCRIWAKVEKLAQKKQARVLPSPPASDVEVVTDGVAQIDLSQNEMSSNSSTTYVQGAPFWPHLGSHHSSLLNLATLSAHHGLFQDAIYYGEQALKIDRTLDANVRMIAAQTQLGSYRIIGGHLSEGQELLAAASDSSKQLQTSVESVALHLALASFYESQEQHEKALCVLREADKLITSLIASDAVPSLVGPNVAVLDEKMAKLQVRSSRKPAATPAPATPARRTRAASSAAAPRTTKKATASKAPAPEIQSSTLLRLRSLILRQQADCLRALRDFDGSAQSLIEARQCATARESKVSVEIGESEHLLADAIRHFASHAVYCVLPESTISLPSLTSPVKGGEQVTPASVKPTAAKKTRTPARTTRTKAQKASEDFVMMLSKANDCLMGVFSDATVLGSTLESHAASRLMSRISMLSHATTPGGSATWVQSPANMNEIGRVGAFARERMAIDFDRKLSDFGDPLLWPTSVPQNDEISGDICSNFAEKYVDILPENWNVLSLSLSADGSEFYVSRLQRNRSPFLLRLPLRRGNSEEDEEEQFTFEDGKEEMQELIKLANQSAHAAKAQTTKQMKKEWWKNREDLDRRMESLLQNVENVWFGGFRGIFSPLARNSDAFGRFVDAFQSILDKHLPSRQKGGKASTPRLVLHQNVLELFIGLRDLEDQEEPDDILMDLLYFVVDILQFQGERNAYDEIDFDMMVVDTLDALRGYHEAAREDVAADSPRHTVLVLDKALHLFPWESLPCLQGFPVCRVPSLECLRDRVLQFRGSQAGATIQHTSGTYLLNPTSDLRSTQESFEPGLSRLESWTGMVNREPSEEEFRSALETKDLFLYFGHGSGAQYIRGRTVKRLTKCAVAFLMGCSSGTLTEAGEYEPYGTPMNYLQAGSPALVATLWDVTDKDIDRFATSTFGSWGLLDRKGKSSRESPNSLDAAVAGARASCVLKYLNGAAPVVYGVPVFLE